MGKVKKPRQRLLYTKKASQSESPDKTTKTIVNENLKKFQLNPVLTKIITPSTNKIPLVVKKSPIIKKQINKKAKLKRRRSKLIENIKQATQETVKAAEQKKREKTIITGDLNPLRDALPSLESLMRLNPNEIKTGIAQIDSSKRKEIIPKILSNKDRKQIKLQKNKKLTKEYKKKFQHLQQVLSHENYISNPREAIAAHVQMITEGYKIKSTNKK